MKKIIMLCVALALAFESCTISNNSYKSQDDHHSQNTLVR